MSREKQIDEMAKDLCEHYDTGGCDSGNCECYRWCNVYSDCAVLHKKGYRKQSEWISVDERLPEKNVRVLVYIKSSSRSYTRFDTDRLDDRGFVRWFNDVTHWMPLPEAPKMKGGE